MPRASKSDCQRLTKAKVRTEHRTVTVTVARPAGRSQTYYLALTVPELLDEIKECVSGVSFSRNQTNREIRDRLLPALLELKKKTYRRKPGFYESLAAIGLNADTVRQWFHRSNAAGEIRCPGLMPTPPLHSRLTSDGVASTCRMHRVNQELACTPRTLSELMAEWHYEQQGISSLAFCGSGSEFMRSPAICESFYSG
jgi:hypothetical protein